MMISLKDWAKKNGISNATARQRALRGTLKTVQKAGRDWIINENEKLIDNRWRRDMTIKTYTSNWEVFKSGESITIQTSSEEIGPDVFDSLEEASNWVIDEIENNLGALTEEEKEEVKTECGIYFSSRF